MLKVFRANHRRKVSLYFSTERVPMCIQCDVSEHTKLNMKKYINDIQKWLKMQWTRSVASVEIFKRLFISACSHSRHNMTLTDIFSKHFAPLVCWIALYFSMADTKISLHTLEIYLFLWANLFRFPLRSTFLNVFINLCAKFLLREKLNKIFQSLVGDKIMSQYSKLLYHSSRLSVKKCVLSVY